MKKTLEAVSFGGIVKTLLVSSMLLHASCKSGNTGGLKVAGGTIDGSSGPMKYPGTVYVELSGLGFDGRPNIVRNVGTLVDIGSSQNLGLVLSLADSIQYSGGRSILPLFKSATLKLFLSNDNDAITLPGMNFSNDGILKDSQNRSYVTLAVGIKAEKIGPSKLPDDKVRSFANKVFLEEPLIADGRNYRVPETSYMLIAVPRSAHPSLSAENLKAPSIVAAEDRGDEAALDKLQIVGFGDNVVGGEDKSVFQLNDFLPSVMKRNFADVDALNTDKAQKTPLRTLIGDNSPVSQQIWEISGSGLCGAPDSENFDTGAAVYQDGKFIGFAVRSSSKTSGFKGRLECGSTSRPDMVSIVVSPSRQALAKFRSLVK